MRRVWRRVVPVAALALSAALGPLAPSAHADPAATDQRPGGGQWVHLETPGVLAPNGQERRYHVRLPRGHWTGARPTLVLLHGVALSPTDSWHDYGLDALADRYGIVLVAGEGYSFSWAAGGCCYKAAGDNVFPGSKEATQRHLVAKVDDVAYVNAVIADARGVVQAWGEPINTARLAVVGFSNGGMLAARWACAQPGNAIAVSVAGPLLGGCAHEVHLLHVHGTRDGTVPITGGISTYTHTAFPDSTREKYRIPHGSVYALWKEDMGHSWGAKGHAFGLTARIWTWIEKQENSRR